MLDPQFKTEWTVRDELVEDKLSNICERVVSFQTQVKLNRLKKNIREGVACLGHMMQVCLAKQMFKEKLKSTRPQ